MLISGGGWTIGRTWHTAGLVLMTAVALAACTSPPPAATPSAAAVAPTTLPWAETTLPTPPGPPGRLALRDAVDCAGRWYVVGGVFGPDGATRPAAWDSADGRTWHGITFAPLPTSYYGPQNIIYTVSCAKGPDGTTMVAMVGARSGGVHGNPRISTWYLRPDGAMAEVPAAFNTYGGEFAVNVARLTAGPAGFLIVGNRTSGAAVWLSPDAKEFRLVEKAPVLAADGQTETAARDATPLGDRWVVVGGVAKTGAIDRDAAVWLSRDGTGWSRADVPAEAGYDELQRVARLGDDVVAAGLRGETFGTWRSSAGTGGATWQAASRFGSTTGGAIADVRSLTAAGGRLLCAANDGASYGLWLSADRGTSWRPVSLPAKQPSGAERTVAIAAREGTALLVTDDGTAGRAWIAAI